MRISNLVGKSAALSLILAFCSFAIGPVEAAVPKLLTYQGVLKNGSGSFLTGTYSIVFRIYSASSGGSALWTETQSSVSASSGKFSVTLGSVTTLGLDFNSDYWLSIQVGADAEMSPRVRLTSMGYGIRTDFENNGFTQTQHDALSHKSIEGVKDSEVEITKTNFKLDSYSLAAANSMGDLIIDSLNDASGINSGASLNYTYRGTPNYDVTLTPTGGGVAQSSTTQNVEDTMLYTNAARYGGIGETFQVASSKTVNSASFKWRRVGSPSGNVRLRLYSVSSGIPNTLLAESSDIAVSSIPTTSTEFTASFTPTTLSASTDYAIVIESTTASGDTSNFIYYQAANSDVYSGSLLWKGSGGAWTTAASWGTNWDAYFKVYEQVSYSGTATVISNAYSEPTAPTEAMIVADETLGTGSIAYYVSRDNGTTWTACTKETVTNISAQPTGTQLKWKAVITGNAELNSIGVAV